MADNKPTNDNQPSQPTPGSGSLLDADRLSGWTDDDITIEEPKLETVKSSLREDFAENTNTEKKEEQKTDEQAAAQELEKGTEEDEVTEDEQPVLAAPALPEDPGEFQPSDYSFEVTVYDSEGNKPKQVRVDSVSEWEKLLEDEPNLGNSLSVNRAFRAAQKMESGLEREQREWEQKVETYNGSVEKYNTQVQIQTGMANELTYLSQKGELPPLTKEERDSLNWEDASVLKAHPNIAAHKAVLDYMVTESRLRVKAGLPKFTSVVDAYNAMQVDNSRKGAEESRRQAGEARKAAGARVSGGSSSPMASQAPKGVRAGRVIGDLSNLGQNWDV